MADARCAAYERGDWEQALLVDQIRGQRVLLGSLSQNDGLSDTLDEIRECPTCLAGIVTWLAGGLANRYSENFGRDASIEQLTQTITGDLDKLARLVAKPGRRQ